jgi:hypothetical protein
MKKILSILVSATALTVATQLPGHAEAKKNYVGPAITFDSGLTLFGAKGNFGISDNFSIRPEISFGSVGGVSVTTYAASATYNFDMPGQSSNQFTPYVGFGLLGATASAGTSSASGSGTYINLGTDLDVSDNFVLNGELKVGVGGSRGTDFAIGAGYKF